MKRIFFKIVSVITGLITLTSCNAIRMLYGVPSARFHLSGRVTDTNQRGIKGIQVQIEKSPETVVYSDENGSWDINSTISYFESGGNITIEYTDIDGLENGGLFEEKSVDIKAEAIEAGSGDFDNGTFEKKGIVVVLDENRTSSL